MKKNFTFNALVIATVILLLIAVLVGKNGNDEIVESSTNDKAGQPYVEKDQTSTMYASMTGDDFDRAYLADMIAHHQGALNMAVRAQFDSTKSEIRTLAGNILDVQVIEIEKMIKWQQEWGYVIITGDNPHAGHEMMEGGSMGEEMAEMEKVLNNLSGEAYDKEFLRQMILHHQQAVDMSKYAETNARHGEIKEIARTIIKTQSDEIVAMKTWQQKWGY